MASGPRILLDYEGDGEVPSGCDVVADEVSFLGRALGPGSLLVRGKSLCNWADAFYQGRGVTCGRARSLPAILRSLCESLSDEQAGTLSRHFGGQIRGLLPDVSLDGLLKACFPTGPWYEELSWRHAAAWLLWLDTEAPPECAWPLLRMQGLGWAARVPGELARLYGAHTPGGARDELAWWLSISDGPGPMPPVPLPVPVPPVWCERARNAWEQRVVATSGKLFSDLVVRPLPRELLELAAHLTFRYFCEHPTELSLEIASQIRPYLLHAEAEELDGLCPPAVPSEVPSKDEAVLQWYVREYLPYRRWEARHGDAPARELVRRLARQFVEWCLATYPAAVVGGSGHQHLAITRAVALRETKGKWATLWVILDGMHYEDAERLKRLLLDDASRLSGALQAVVSPLPTVTRFSKASVINGKPAVTLEDEAPTPRFEGARMLPAGKDPAVAIKNAQPGDVLVWSLLEPDKTYHQPCDEITLMTRVQGQLQGLAQQIRAAVQAAPDDLPVRVVVSTDHGRMMGSCERVLDIPSGMEAHGRAAWGGIDVELSGAGYKIDEERRVVFLGADHFRLPANCAVALDDGVFLTSDGRKGNERFPHGGLYPEEVLVPWVELIRDWAPPRMTCTLKGEARAGRPGVANLMVTNPGDTPVVVRTLTLALSDSRLELEVGQRVPSLSSAELPVSLAEWPRDERWKGATALLQCALPNGFEFQAEASVNCTSRQMVKAEGPEF